MERTIRVTGRGRIKARPDTIELIICVSKVCPEYREAMETSSKMTKKMKEALERAGFDPAELKTTSFSVNADYEGEYDEKGVWHNVFRGYRYDHNMVLRFGLDNDRLGKVLYELSRCEANAEISIRHTVKDPEPIKNALLENAVKDSREKAKILAAASEVELGRIINIDYSWGEVEIYNRMTERMPLSFGSINAKEDSLDIDLEADDINVQDTVTVVWEIR